MESSTQRPLEMILARNLLSALSTPAFLVNQPGGYAQMGLFNAANQWRTKVYILQVEVTS